MLEVVRSTDQKANTYMASAAVERLARRLLDLSSAEPNIQIAPPKTERVIHPRVPAWTWVRSVFLGGSHTSVPLRTPITTVMMKITNAARNRFLTPDGIAPINSPSALVGRDYLSAPPPASAITRGK
jgi:hypothetical protein